MDVLNWMGDHPILTFFLAYMAMCAVIAVAVAVGQAFSHRTNAKEQK